MVPTMEEIIEDLNRRYFADPDGYVERVEMFKGMGYKIYRNSAGKHKVQLNNDYLKEAFGGVFGGIFG